jgi:NAD(P)-dependent dehydrogenase (short-subunit alcohol dehydrogenase family)
MAAPRVWLLTGSSTEIGLEICKVIASRGEHVVDASRSPKKHPLTGLAGVTPTRLDPIEPLP